MIVTMGRDGTDHAILTILQADGRVTNAELADRVGLSPSACLRRVRVLEESGVIASYAALVDPTAIGRPTSVFVEISLASQEEGVLDRFEEAVVTNPAVMSCHLMAGDADYLVHVMCADVNDYERLHRTHLAQLPGVARIRSSFALRTVVDRTALDF
ncbi:MAG: Lrp/AsnC family leucine-responsive transcriptional regulator [Acidimicrobiales bacterium]|jgi:Lrp/AsnC family transcriptional regulator, leucine-responsive regulatory protein